MELFDSIWSLVLLAPFILLMGGFFDFVGGLLGKVAPLAGFIPGVGPIASAALGGLGGLLGGGGAEGAAKGAFAGMSTAEIRKAMEQARKDQARSRKLTEEAIRTAQEKYAANAPMREGFRSGVFNLQDRTNPFATNVFSGEFLGGYPGTPPFNPGTQPTAPTGGSPLGTQLGGLLGQLGGGGGSRAPIGEGVGSPIMLEAMRALGRSGPRTM
jgi:hypothetical protein